MLIGASPVARLDLDFVNVRSAKGMLRICIANTAKNFPACKDEHHGIARSMPASARELLLEGLPPGDYAVAVIHDENGNGKLDTFAGIPREGSGFSRNPSISFGPPSFAAARFPIDGDGARQTIRIRYLL